LLENEMSPFVDESGVIAEMKKYIDIIQVHRMSD
jgi:hypothetical protein